MCIHFQSCVKVFTAVSYPNDNGDVVLQSANLGLQLLVAFSVYHSVFRGSSE